MHTTSRATHVGRAVLILLLALVGWGSALSPASAGQAESAQALVDRSRITLEEFVADQEMGPAMTALIRRLACRRSRVKWSTARRLASSSST